MTQNFDELFGGTASTQDVSYAVTGDFVTPISNYINLVAPNGEDVVPPDYPGAAVSVYMKGADGEAVKYYTKSLRVLIIDPLQTTAPGSSKVVGARRMAAYDLVTGQAQTKTKDTCGSANGLFPYQSYVGAEVINPANGKKVIIGCDKNGAPITDVTKICANCPLAQYHDGAKVAVPCADNWGVVVFILPQTLYTFTKGAAKGGRGAAFTKHEHVFEQGFLARINSGGRYNMQRAMFPTKTAIRDGAKGITWPIMNPTAVVVNVHEEAMYVAHDSLEKQKTQVEGVYEVTTLATPMFPQGRPDIVQQFVPVYPMVISAYSESVSFGPTDAAGNRSSTRVAKPSFELEAEPVTDEGVIRQFSEAMMGYVVDGMRARLMGGGSMEAVKAKLTELPTVSDAPQLPIGGLVFDE